MLKKCLEKSTELRCIQSSKENVKVEWTTKAHQRRQLLVGPGTQLAGWPGAGGPRGEDTGLPLYTFSWSNLSPRCGLAMPYTPKTPICHVSSTLQTFTLSPRTHTTSGYLLWNISRSPQSRVV